MERILINNLLPWYACIQLYQVCARTLVTHEREGEKTITPLKKASEN